MLTHISHPAFASSHPIKVSHVHILSPLLEELGLLLVAQAPAYSLSLILQGTRLTKQWLRTDKMLGLSSAEEFQAAVCALLGFPGTDRKRSSECTPVSLSASQLLLTATILQRWLRHQL